MGLAGLLSILKSAFFKSGDCFIWREADTPELADNKGLRDGVEEAWLEKDEEYVLGSVAAEVKYEDANAVAKRRREKKRKTLG